MTSMTDAEKKQKILYVAATARHLRRFHMPYIAIQAYPKDEEIKKRVVERINQVFLEEWGCPQSAISISMEEVAPENWEKDVVEGQILPKEDKMMILSGEKKY